MSTPATDRARASKDRKRAAGMIEVRSLYAHPADVAAIRHFARGLAEARFMAQPNRPAEPKA